MQLKSIAVITVLLLVASLSVAGCTSNTTSPTPTPVPDYSQHFRNSILLGVGNFTPVNPMTLTTNQTYVGTYRSHGNDSVWKIQLFGSESEAKANYGQLILQKSDAGFVSQSNESSSGLGATVFGDTKASWSGYKLESYYSGTSVLIDFGFNDYTNQWFVASITRNISG